ncbi:MAG TPA: FadR/GntR family transcriptional regulator [Hyphomonas sp.]|nr:FadR family transcriptional regulator [Hyphomonas sp.]HRI99207.1 FadR/GntR family transcriptional regulator [Hyphomonas sp.]HRK65994.1 FadR/GntR family transcriptional regulator [Hyphomonas sp.]
MARKAADEKQLTRSPIGPTNKKSRNSSMTTSSKVSAAPADPPMMFADRAGGPAVLANQIMDNIRSGVWNAGDKLPTERQMALDMGVSRSSLREALRALEILGLLRMRQGSGVYVSSLDADVMLIPLHLFVTLEPANVESLFEARMILESEVAALAASRITDNQLARLRETVVSPPERREDIEKFIEADVAFHNVITEVADNPILARMVTSIEYLGRASRQLTGYVPGVLKRSARDHKAILDAMAARSPEQARSAMMKHLINVREAYRKRNK